ncbi:unnamed protein product, partial [Clonostachys rosea]
AVVSQLVPAIKCLYYHPLSKYPGPKLAAVTSFVALYWTFKGRLHEWTAEQHRIYGPVVRLRPNELSFIDQSAWKEIYSFRQGQKQMPKILRTKPVNGRPNLMSATDEDHARQRKLLAHAFSDQALRSQESILRSYADLLVEKLNEVSGRGDTDVDIQEWLTFATFDIIGDLSFGKPFGNLENGKATGWVGTFKHGIKQGVLFSAFRSIWSPFWDRFWTRQLGPYVQAKRHQQGRYAAAAVNERLERKTERPDFISYCLRGSEGGKSLPREELASMFTIVALAGCESPATALSGTLYYLMNNPGPYRKLKEEVRAVEKDEDLTLARISRMEYLKAVIDESMRLYPPVPAAMDRVVPGDGAMIAGHWIPAGTWVGICQYAANRSDKHFAEPLVFAPERYLESRDAKFQGDARGVVQPFSLGPRNCIGQNLARAEIRLILAKLTWHFDLELSSVGTDWLREQKAYGLWDKDPLLIRIHSARA